MMHRIRPRGHPEGHGRAVSVLISFDRHGATDTDADRVFRAQLVLGLRQMRPCLSAATRSRLLGNPATLWELDLIPLFPQPTRPFAILIDQSPRQFLSRQLRREALHH